MIATLNETGIAYLKPPAFIDSIRYCYETWYEGDLPPSNEWYHPMIPYRYCIAYSVGGEQSYSPLRRRLWYLNCMSAGPHVSGVDGSGGPRVDPRAIAAGEVTPLAPDTWECDRELVARVQAGHHFHWQILDIKAGRKRPSRGTVHKRLTT